MIFIFFLSKTYNKITFLLFIKDLEFNVETEPKGTPAKSASSRKYLEEDLWHNLIEFMSANVSYTIKRLLPADLKSIYTQKPLENADEKFKINPFAKDYKITPNPEKGGINVCENVVYNW